MQAVSTAAIPMMRRSRAPRDRVVHRVAFIVRLHTSAPIWLRAPPHHYTARPRPVPKPNAGACPQWVVWALTDWGGGDGVARLRHPQRRLLGLDAPGDGRNVVGDIHSSEQAARVEHEACRVGIDHDEHAVLVDNVESIDRPDMLPIPTSIRFERIDRLQELLRGVWYLSLRRGLDFTGRWSAVPPDRERHVRDIGRISRGGIGEVVEAGSDGVNGVTEDERNGPGDRPRLPLTLMSRFPLCGSSS